MFAKRQWELILMHAMTRWVREAKYVYVNENHHKWKAIRCKREGETFKALTLQQHFSPFSLGLRPITPSLNHHQSCFAVKNGGKSRSQFAKFHLLNHLRIRNGINSLNWIKAGTEIPQPTFTSMNLKLIALELNQRCSLQIILTVPVANTKSSRGNGFEWKNNLSRIILIKSGFILCAFMFPHGSI